MDSITSSYRTKSFISERNISSISYEIKRTRAVWDDALSIPGTERRGGWRCPPGTRYGGQITDRFGRNCGWGVSRRLANQISDLGERLENVAERRQRRREERALRRQGRGAGAVERAAGRVARALESTDATPEAPRRRERQGPARQRPNLRLSEQRRMEREIAQPGAPRTDEPRAPRGRRRGNLRASEERRMEREIVQPGAPRTGERRRRATADVVDKPRPEAPRVPAKKQPVKKQAAKKKAVKKKAPAKKASVRKLSPDNKPANEKPKLSAGNRADAKPQVIDMRDIAVNNGIIPGDFSGAAARIDEFTPNINGAEQVAQDLRALENRLRNQPDDAVVRVPKTNGEGFTTVRIADLRNNVGEAAAAWERLVERRDRGARRDSQPDWEQLADIDFNDNNAVRKLEDVFRPLYGDEPWLDARAGDMILRNAQANEENYLDGLNEFPVAQRRATVEANINRFDTIIKAELEELNDLNLRIANEPDARKRKRIAQDMMSKTAKIRLLKMRKRENENFLRNIKDAPEKPNTPDVVPELPNKPEKALDIVDKKALDDAKKRVSGAIEKNKKILGDYLDDRYGEGNAPWKEMTPARIQELVRDANSGDQTAKAALVNWAKQMYSHDKIKGANGKNYKIEVNVSYFNGVISVNGVIRRQKRDGEWSRPIGETRRTINISGSNPDNWEITNYLLKLSYEQDKSAGIATIYNHHAFMYGKAAGIKKATVGSAWDGPYVWGRFGYRSNLPIDVGRMKLELDKFKQGQNGLIKNKEEAARITALLNEHKKLNDANVPYADKRHPRHIDFILALDIPREPKEERTARQAQLKSWFINNMPMGRGVYFFDENNISDDPRS